MRSGEASLKVAIVVTVVFALVQTAAVIAPEGFMGGVSVAWSVACFTVGSAVFLWAVWIAAARSRDEPVTVAGVVWLIGTVPAATARILRSVLLAQVVIAVVTASIRPFSAVAFGVLMPMFGLGQIAWYGARHGVFSAVVREAPVQPHAGRVEPADPAGTRGSDGAGAPVGPPPQDRADPDDFDQLFRRRRRP